MKKHLWSLLTRLVDSYCDQTQLLEGTLEPFCDLGPLLAGGEVDMGRENERGGIYVDTISGPSVLTACHKFQAETKSVKANIISCFQFVLLQNVSVSIHASPQHPTVIVSSYSDTVLMGMRNPMS